MALTNRTAFSLLGQLEDVEDVDEVEVHQEAPQQEPQQPRMPPRPVRPAAPPRPKGPPDVTDRLTQDDKKYTRMCEHLLNTGRCDRPNCWFAHTREQQKAAKQKLARRVAEERAKLGWVPPREEQHLHPCHDHHPAGGAAGGQDAGSSRPGNVNWRTKTVICFHWLNNNGYCRFGDRCNFAHGETELRRYQPDEAAVQRELAKKGLASTMGPLQPPHHPPQFSGHSSSSHHPPPPPPPSAALLPPSAATVGAVGAVPMSGAALAEYLTTAAQLEDEEDAPECFICPITQVLLDDPVVASDGHTYERHAIEAWLTTRGTSPLTGEPLADTRLLPNHTLVAAMRAVLGDHVCAGRKHE